MPGPDCHSKEKCGSAECQRKTSRVLPLCNNEQQYGTRVEGWKKKPLFPTCHSLCPVGFLDLLSCFASALRVEPALPASAYPHQPNHGTPSVRSVFKSQSCYVQFLKLHFLCDHYHMHFNYREREILVFLPNLCPSERVSCRHNNRTSWSLCRGSKLTAEDEEPSSSWGFPLCTWFHQPREQEGLDMEITSHQEPCSKQHVSYS